MAVEVTIPLNSSTGFTGDTSGYTATTDGFTFSYTKGSNDAIAPTDAHIRVYKGGTFTVKGDNGQQITSMVMAGDGTKYCGFNAASAGSGSWSGTTYTWTGDANEVAFTAGAAQTRIKSVVITYTPAGGVVVTAPTISPEGGKYSEAQTVTITAEAGLRIFYTLDGQTPTDDTADGSSMAYSAPFTVDKTTTVKAIAYDSDDNKSGVTTVSYEIVEAIPGGEGDGTEADPYNAVAAINAANMGSTADVYVKGIISEIKSIDTGNYGNAEYYISADGTATNQFYIYRGYGLGGVKFTSADDIKVGDRVVVNGKLTTYNGAPQLASGSKIISINGEEPEPIVLEGEGTETKPFTVEDVIKINPTDTNTNTDYPDKYWVKGYIVGACNDQVFADAIFGTEGVTSKTNIVVAPTADCTDINLCIPVQLPTGAVRDALNLVDNPTNIKGEVTVYGNILKYFSVPGVKNTSDYKLVSASVDGIAIEENNAPVEYFNLQGVRVDNPANGLYIMRQGNKATKVLVK